jgi:hypothetical protein
MPKKAIFVLAFAMLLALGANAQTTLNDVYWVSYYENANIVGLDQLVEIVNPGVQGAPITGGPIQAGTVAEGALCANVYVFDRKQEMLACCSFYTTANEFMTLSVNGLTSKPLTGGTISAGAIKITSSIPSGTTCDPTAITSTLGTTAGNLAPDLGIWGTHLHNLALVYALTESSFQGKPLSTSEAQYLPTTCGLVLYLGSGKGTCTAGEVAP